MQKIKSDLKTGVFSNLYLFYGPEAYLADFYADKIIEANIENGTEELNLLKISAEIPEEKTIDEFVSSYPFMGEKKVLYIRNSGLLKKSAEAQKKYWCTLFSDIPDYVIIIFSEREIDKRNGIYKQISKNNCAHEFAYQNERALTQWTVKILNAAKKQISVSDASYFAQICGPSMYNIKNEAEKLISYKSASDTVNKEDIEKVCAKNTENRVFEMVDDIISMRIAEAYKKLSDLKVLNEEPVKLISIIFKKFSSYKKLCILKNKPIREICSLTGMYEKYARNDLNNLKNLSEKKIDSVMNKCMEMDFAVKAGKIDKWLAIDMIIAEAVK